MYPKDEADAVAEYYASRGRVALDPSWGNLPDWDSWLSVARWLRHPRPDLLREQYPLWWYERTKIRMNAETDAFGNDN